MKKFQVIVASTVLLATVGMAFAANPPEVAARQGLMGTIGKQMKTLAGFAKGTTPYDAAAAAAALTTISKSATEFPKHFPKGTEMGASGAGDTAALAKIWETPDDFAAKSAKLSTDAAAAATASAGGLDAFKAAFATVAANCSSCHEAYRGKVN